jgi:hypothetical protein
MARARAISQIVKLCSSLGAGVAIVTLAFLTSARGGETPPDKPIRSWNVTDFGAVGDTKTPSADAINAAINACSNPDYSVVPARDGPPCGLIDVAKHS